MSLHKIELTEQERAALFDWVESCAQISDSEDGFWKRLEAKLAQKPEKPKTGLCVGCGLVVRLRADGRTAAHAFGPRGERWACSGGKRRPR